ncbi:MAG: Amuc_1100 family pilus-like protein [Verrucomicrobiota bacterium]
MNLGKNKFLVGLAAALVVGGGTFGYLLFDSYSKYSGLNEQYSTLSGELTRLQALPLYPEPANLKKLDAKKDAAEEAVKTLNQQLVPLSFPLEQISPEQFQDQLRVAVSATSEKAKALGVKLPEKFYLGFDNYRTLPPKAEAAANLGRELKAVELAVNTLIESKVATIDSVIRTPLPEEGEPSKVAAQPSITVGRPASTAPKATPLITKFPFEIQFSAEQSHFRNGLNALVKNSKQFFIVRPVTIKNDVEKPLSRAEANPTPKTQLATSVNPGDPAAGAVPPPAEEPALHYIVGTEKVTVGLRVEMVVFASSLSK